MNQASGQENTYTLCKRDRNEGLLEYELLQETIRDINLNRFIRYNIFNDDLKEDEVMRENSHNQHNYFDCEREYSKIIGISLYNETYQQLEQSLISIFRNRIEIDSNSINYDFIMSKTLIIIIADGFEQLDEKLVEKFESFGLLDIKTLRSKKREIDINLDKDSPYPDITYFFQGELGCYKNDASPNPEDNSVTSRNIIKVVFAVKLKNRKKLHSHLLLLMLCARKLQPEFILLDTGTVPRNDGIYFLIKAMVEDEQISGCCGELEIDLNFNDLNESFWDNLEKKSILKAQWLEYKFSHCLQKTFESSCGFIPVLPGAFCAYRWSALKAKNYFVIKEYLKPFDQPHLIGWTQSNIYHLAEDRVILDKISKLDTETEPSCWSSGHFLTFIKDSKATTDGPESILQLINQRRRWNNGAWFSLNQTLWKTCNSKNICLTQHSPIRKLALILQVSYYILLVSFQWCSVGAFYLAFAMALRKIITDEDQMSFLLPLFEGIYLILTFCLFCISLVIGAGDLNDKVVENRAVKVKRNRCGSIIFNYLALFYFLVLLYILIVLLYVLIAVGFESEVYLIVIIIVPCTLILSLMLYDPSSICKYALCALPYAYYIPTYVNILQIYAICKTDDVSWGTRGNDYNSKHEAFKYKKFFYLIAYVLSNSIFGFLFERFFANGADRVLGFLYGAALILILIPFIGEIYYLIFYVLGKCRKPRVDATPYSVNYEIPDVNHPNNSQTVAVSPSLKTYH